MSPAPTPRPDAVEAVAAEVRLSRRYRWVAPDLIARLAAESFPGARNQADAVKRTKRRLHQVCGAYVQELPADALLESLRHAALEGGPDALREASRAVLARHASTRERLLELPAFYARIFERTGTPRVLLDLACGLNPLAWPWMGLPPDTTYLASDVDGRLIALVDGFLTLCGVPHAAEQRDLVTHPPETPADVALLLKSSPCLEQQAPGVTRRLLDAIAARCVVLSFPTRSLGGASRGMAGHYRAQLETTLAGAPWSVAELPFRSELVCVLTRSQGIP